MTTATAAPPAVPAKIIFQGLVAIDKIDVADNFRKEFDPVYMKELTDSVRARGVDTPILLRPKGNRYELVAGACRLRDREADADPRHGQGLGRERRSRVSRHRKPSAQRAQAHRGSPRPEADALGHPDALLPRPRDPSDGEACRAAVDFDLHIHSSGGVVGDFFAGSGSGGEASFGCGRAYLGSELDDKMATIAQERIAQLLPMGGA